MLTNRWLLFYLSQGNRSQPPKGQWKRGTSNGHAEVRLSKGMGTFVGAEMTNSRAHAYPMALRMVGGGRLWGGPQDVRPRRASMTEQRLCVSGTELSQNEMCMCMCMKGDRPPQHGDAEIPGLYMNVFRQKWLPF